MRKGASWLPFCLPNCQLSVSHYGLKTHGSSGFQETPYQKHRITRRVFAAGTAASIALSLKSLTNTCRAFDHRRNPSPAVRLSHRRSCDTARVAQQHAFEREPGTVSWPLNREVVVNPSLGARRKRPCFRRSQFRLCLKMRCMSADTSDVSSYSVLTELHQFPLRSRRWRCCKLA